MLNHAVFNIFLFISAFPHLPVLVFVNSRIALCASCLFCATCRSQTLVAQYYRLATPPGDVADWGAGLQSGRLRLGTQHDLTAREIREMVFSIESCREPDQIPIN